MEKFVPIVRTYTQNHTHTQSFGIDELTPHHLLTSNCIVVICLWIPTSRLCVLFTLSTVSKKVTIIRDRIKAMDVRET